MKLFTKRLIEKRSGKSYIDVKHTKRHRNSHQMSSGVERSEGEWRVSWLITVAFVAGSKGVFGGTAYGLA